MLQVARRRACSGVEPRQGRGAVAALRCRSIPRVGLCRHERPDLGPAPDRSTQADLAVPAEVGAELPARPGSPTRPLAAMSMRQQLVARPARCVKSKEDTAGRRPTRTTIGQRCLQLGCVLRRHDEDGREAGGSTQAHGRRLPLSAKHGCGGRFVQQQVGELLVDQLPFVYIGK